MENWRALNLASWEERTALHVGPRGYDLSSHRAGHGRLDRIVEAELGSVAGLRILHLQCHIGHDSIALAQRGAAEVLGVDFSPAAIAAARGLAAEVGATQARFIEADIGALPGLLPAEAGIFDLAFVTWGTIWWLPDIRRWAEVIAHFLRPGAALYFADAHPAALVFDDGVPGAHPVLPGPLVPYFERTARVFDEPTDYADTEARVANSRTITWLHPLGDIISALCDAGLRLAWLHEHPAIAWQMFRTLVRGPDRLWTWPADAWLPLSVSLRAERV
ncbi:class I SAM-dependent methyltransferase [Plastoroseomonas arctica]|uniref:Class I SAM-dependent methyltransferase n=1 Tax=Plastoroseomonas arctica TaxID=1509237 RepID=A0AAF1JYZ9_9PROT|nr:class I SAM-dependent methyltransferase [Plastoroseomonas arctica]MBR0657364.1 class I SAM-dependent methyltransferase [Plastoroseomonas arctica]